MITDHDLVLACAATYTNPNATFTGLDGTARVFRSVVGDVAIYAIEGTHDNLGWFLDFMALPVEEHVTVERPYIGWVHGGIFAVLDSVWDELLATVKTDVSAGLQVAVTGHSLGAGCAVIATALLVAIDIEPVRCSFFAPPKVGFKKMLDLVAEIPGNGYRNGNDPVPEVPFYAPPLWLYQQVPLLRGGKDATPPWEAHHIALYVALEEAINGPQTEKNPSSTPAA